MLFGSDFPLAAAQVGTSFTNKLDTYVAGDSTLAAMINRQSALALFPRLARQDL